jgi:hypothetical protein
VIDTVEKVTSFTQSNLIGQIKQAFENLPDACSGNGVYQKYAMPDAALSAFSVFFMQSPSFLDDQKTMEKERGKNIATKIVLSSTWNSLIFPLCCKPLNTSL